MDIRERILARLKELDLSQQWLAGKLGKSRGYLTDYFVKRKPKELSLELRAKAADALGLPRKELNAEMTQQTSKPAKPGGFSENDVEPYVPPKGGYLTVQPHILLYRVLNTAMDMATPPILPGMVLRVDINKSKPEALKNGQIVVAQRMGLVEGLDHRETILRVFMAPDKLVTNSSGTNEIERITDPARGTNVVIRGTMVGWFGESNDDDGWQATRQPRA